MRVFLDANILFLGSLPGSRMRGFLEIILEHAEGVSNCYAVEEARRNLIIRFPQHARHLDPLVARCELIPAFGPELEVEIKAKDVPILMGALVGSATHLLTGDQRDFGMLWGKTIQGVKVVSPKMLAEVFVQRGWMATG